MLKNIVSVLDFFPGAKSNTGLVILLLTTVAQMAGANQPMVELIKEVATALMAYGVTVRAAKTIVK